MNSTPNVSVIIPSFRRPEALRSAIESALAEPVPGVEVIVVDDDPDRSAEPVACGSIMGSRVAADRSESTPVRGRRGHGGAGRTALGDAVGTRLSRWCHAALTSLLLGRSRPMDVTTIVTLSRDAPTAEQGLEPLASSSNGVPNAAVAGSAERRASIERTKMSVRGLWRSEVAQFRPGLVLGSALARVLPAHTAGRTRVAVLRAAGLSIGRSTEIAGALRVDRLTEPSS